jgi:hypothetical protein
LFLFEKLYNLATRAVTTMRDPFPVQETLNTYLFRACAEAECPHHGCHTATRFFHSHKALVSAGPKKVLVLSVRHLTPNNVQLLQRSIF